MRLVLGLFVTTLTFTLVVAGVLIQLLPLFLLLALALRAIRGSRQQRNTLVSSPAGAEGPAQQMPPLLHYGMVPSGPFPGAAWVLVPVWLTPSDPRRPAPVIDAEVIDAEGGWR